MRATTRETGLEHPVTLPEKADVSVENLRSLAEPGSLQRGQLI